MLNEKEISRSRKLFSDTDKTIATTFKVLGDVNRYRIFRIISKQPEISVGSIAQILGISLPLASQHLKILTHANLLQKKRAGRKIFPKLEHNNPLVKAVVKAIEQAAKSVKKKN